jgi:LytS/YehU family sensor histidine kinase
LRNAQSENQLLKAQLNPHFLYNTLNNVDALIWLDQERASSAVMSLSNLMRYMTYSARQEKVPLSDEARAIGILCDLQRLRMPKPECLVFEVVGTQGENTVRHERMIAPLLLVPLVENCFKHCGLTSEADAIRICLEEGEDMLKFSTDNNLPTEVEGGSAKATQHGVGLTVLRRRLELIYPDSYTFSARREGNRFKTMLTISC